MKTNVIVSYSKIYSLKKKLKEIKNEIWKMCKTKNTLILVTIIYSKDSLRLKVITAACFISCCFGQDQDKTQLQKRDSED